MRKKSPAVIFIFAFTRFVQPISASAIFSAGIAYGSAPSVAVSNSGQQKDELIKPSRPTESEPADIQKVGVLQLKFGLEADFDSEESRIQQTLLLELRFATTRWLLMACQIETVKSQVDPSERRMAGVGDVELGFHVLPFKQTDNRPAIAFAYHVELCDLSH